MKLLKNSDIYEDARKVLYPADYTEEECLDGVKIINLNSIPAEEGDFAEILRIKNGLLENIKGFKLAQINRTTLVPGSIKAWHLHYKQDEIWYVSPMGHLLAGLWDVRKSSSTSGKTMRIVLGGGTSRMLFIPRGVAHGSAIFSSSPVELYVFVNQQFNLKHHDEKRIPWDSLGKEFWRPKRD